MLPLPEKGPHKEPLSPSLEPTQWEMGQVSLPASLVGLAVATKQMKTMEEQGVPGMPSPSRAGWPGGCQPGQSQQCHSSATAAWSSPSCWRIPSPSAKGRAKTKNSGKKEISSVSSCWFPAFLCFCGIVCNLLLWGSWGSLSPWCRLQS